MLSFDPECQSSLVVLNMVSNTNIFQSSKFQCHDTVTSMAMGLEVVKH